MRDPYFFAYATAGSPYVAEAEKLRDSMQAFGLALHLRIVAGRGSWQANTLMKATVVRDVLAAHPDERCVYLDVDAVMLDRPALLWTLEANIAAVKFGGKEFLSGVVLFQGEPARQVVNRWITLCDVDNGDTDQRLLERAITETPEATFQELPPQYNLILGLSEQFNPGLKAIILATRGASRFRDFVDHNP